MPAAPQALKQCPYPKTCNKAYCCGRDYKLLNLWYYEEFF